MMETMLKFWPSDAEWFVIAGMADTTEATVIRSAHPLVQCVGLEPNPLYRGHQIVGGFPGIVLPFAAWNEHVSLDLVTPVGATAMSASVCRPADAPDMGGAWTPSETICVEANRLDALIPFVRNAVLWLDVEYAELQALEGASGLFSRGCIRLVNVETYSHLNLSAVIEFMRGYGLHLVALWNEGPKRLGRDAQDYLFLLEGRHDERSL